MSDPTVLFDVIGATARLTLNRPRAMNAFNIAMLVDIGRYLQEIAAREELRAVLVTGAGAAFCAGADLKELRAGLAPPAGERDFIDHCNGVFEQLRSFPKPIVAALNGTTLAGGLELALCADIVIAAESARIGDGHANFGMYPGAGSAAILPRVIPANVALYLLLTGKTLSASEWQAYGLISEVHPDALLQEAALKLTELIAAKSPVGLRRMKAVARASGDKAVTDALFHEQTQFREHMRSLDFLEGLRAFAEKRTPRFQGR
jgi:enoyl-CoA hydratase/carnithine racemase